MKDHFLKFPKSPFFELPFSETKDRKHEKRLCYEESLIEKKHDPMEKFSPVTLLLNETRSVRDNVKPFKQESSFFISFLVKIGFIWFKLTVMVPAEVLDWTGFSLNLWAGCSPKVASSRDLFVSFFVSLRDDLRFFLPFLPFSVTAITRKRGAWVFIIEIHDDDAEDDLIWSTDLVWFAGQLTY